MEYSRWIRYLCQMAHGIWTSWIVVPTPREINKQQFTQLHILRIWNSYRKLCKGCSATCNQYWTKQMFPNPVLGNPQTCSIVLLTFSSQHAWTKKLRTPDSWYGYGVSWERQKCGMAVPEKCWTRQFMDSLLLGPWYQIVITRIWAVNYQADGQKCHPSKCLCWSWGSGSLQSPEFLL